MPGPIAWFAENQPVTSIVNTIRALFAQEPVGSDIKPTPQRDADASTGPCVECAPCRLPRGAQQQGTWPGNSDAVSGEKRQPTELSRSPRLDSVQCMLAERLPAQRVSGEWTDTADMPMLAPAGRHGR
jgi:hypothetical protein